MTLQAGRGELTGVSVAAGAVVTATYTGNKLYNGSAGQAATA